MDHACCMIHTFSVVLLVPGAAGHQVSSGMAGKVQSLSLPSVVAALLPVEPHFLALLLRRLTTASC